ncbi:MAG TPA: hypothetical protein VKX49_21610 [Bryobacteraceae bacterium]|nr:hypothetical protein [Bryobacteraceae bacterium]
MVGLLGLLKTFVLAGLYVKAQKAPAWWDILGLPDYLAAKATELVLNGEMKAAHDQCEALAREVMYAVKNPRVFLAKTKDRYLQMYAQKWETFNQLVRQKDLTSQFRAGEVFGEVLLDLIMLVLTVVGAAELAVRVAGEVPELIKLARNLKGVLKLKPSAARLGQAAAAAEEIEVGGLTTATPANATTYLDDSAFKHYMDVVDHLDVSTKPNEAVFYSGEGNRELAESFATTNGKRTLEMTPGGKWLDDQKLFGKDSPLYGDQARQVWAKLSKRFAQEASGNAVGFVEGANPNGIFNTTESPTLEYNERITALITGGH